MTLPLDSDAQDFGRARDIFLRALDVEPGQLETFIVQACGSDTALLAQVRRLLDADARVRAEQFLEYPTHVSNRASDRPPYIKPGELVGQYRIEGKIGEGGMGVVYFAQDLRLPRRVAVKALSRAHTHDPSRRERFRREASAAAALSHPGIPTVFEFVEHEGELFIVGEYIEGKTLREEIARGPAALSHVIQTAAAIANALAAAHDAGIVHRDLKPENIMRAADGRLKILDFGLAHLRDFDSDVTITKEGSLLGTPAYMAPEQLCFEPVDGRADLFALGIVMYEMATGRRPSLADNSGSTVSRVVDIEALPRGGSSAGQSDAVEANMRAAFISIIRRCLHKSPVDRFASAHELQAELERARDGRVAPSAFATGSPGPQRWWRVHHLATCIAYGGLMVPMWLAHKAIDHPGQRLGLVLFLATLGAVVASIVLRLHLWFTASSIPGQWTRQYRHATPWLRLSDSIAVLGFLVAGGSLIVATNGTDVLAAVLICAGVVTGLSFAVIEPATTRAAFDQDG